MLVWPKTNIYTLIFIGIVLLASLLRLYQLGKVPNGFQGDEAAYGYNAYSLMTTGTDEYGKHFPLILTSFEDYKPAFYAYLDIPFIASFGLNEFAVRLPSALFGIFSVGMLYFLVKKLTHNPVIALIASLALAISPWHLNLSRTTSESVVSLFFLLLMIYSLLKLEEKFSWIWLTAGAISGFLSLGLYTAARFFVLLTSALIVLFSLKKTKHFFSINTSLGLFFVIILVFELFYNALASNKRFDQVNIFTNPATTLVLEEQIREDQFTKPIITRIFHNKIVNYTRDILENYSQYFTLDFLALNGGYPKRERIPNSGEFYLWEIPFILIGLYFAFRNQMKGTLFLFTLWLLLLLPAAITFDDIPNVYRTLVIVPPMVTIIAVGIYYSFLAVKNRPLVIVLFLAMLCVAAYELAYYEHAYFVHQDVHQPWYRNYPMKELSLTLQTYYPEFSTILLTKSNELSYIHILFYTKFDPIIYQKSGSHLDDDHTGFGKYRFTSAECPLNGGKNGNAPLKEARADILYVDSGTCITPTHAKLLKTIYWGDHTPAFKILQYTPTTSVLQQPL